MCELMETNAATSCGHHTSLEHIITQMQSNDAITVLCASQAARKIMSAKYLPGIGNGTVEKPSAKTSAATCEM